MTIDSASISHEDFKDFSLLVEEINAERLAQLREAMQVAHPRNPRLEAVIDAMVMPLVKHSIGTEARNRWSVRCVQAFFVLPLEVRVRIFQQQNKAVYGAFKDALQACLPEMPGSEIDSRLFVAAGALLGAIARLDMVAAIHASAHPDAAAWGMIHSLRDSLCGLFQAPVRAGINASIFIDEANRNRLVEMNTIAAIIVSGNYTRICFRGGGQSEVHRSLASWMQSLPMGKFLQIKRNCIINTDAILGKRWTAQGRLLLEIDTRPSELEVSRRRTREVAQALQGC